MEYNSLKELYKALIPAFKVKKRLMQSRNYLYIKNEDIWNYLTTYKWKKIVGLSLADMTSDIINVKEENIDNYVKSKAKNEIIGEEVRK